MNVGSSSSAVMQQYLQMATSQARPQVQTATTTSVTTATTQSEEAGESRAVQASEGETGGRINTYA